MTNSQSYLIASALFFLAMGVFQEGDNLIWISFSLGMGIGCLIKWVFS